jgi:tRNA pseudouridine55 synthase
VADRAAGPDGLVVVDKEAGWTSHDVVAKLRGILRTRKVGHSGTLDPDATGVLLVGVGRATRLLRYLTAYPKTYVGEMVLGVETSTLDAAGDVVAVHDMAAVTAADVDAILPAFRGAILQVPPMVSAVKIDGRRLHELARAGIEVDRPARPVIVYSLDARPSSEPGVYVLEVACSSGTYVRSLAADIGRAAGGGAHLRNLRRTSVGSFGLDEARRLDAIDDTSILPLPVAVRDMASVGIDDHVHAAVRNGKVLDRPTLGVPAGDAGPWAVLAGDALVAVYEPMAGDAADRVKPAVVFN